MINVHHRSFAFLFLVLLALIDTSTYGAERRVLYNFDGDSCLSTKANSKGPVPITVDDVKRDFYARVLAARSVRRSQCPTCSRNFTESLSQTSQSPGGDMAVFVCCDHVSDGQAFFASELLR